MTLSPILANILGHFLVSLLPMMIFGPLSLVALLWATVLGSIGFIQDSQERET
jgi:hypothetical protein